MSAMPDKNHFKVIHVDCCVPWTVYTDKNIKHQILLLPMVDAATGWPKFGPLLNHTAEAAAKCFNEYWFCHYPQPRKIIYDNGFELFGYSFQKLLDSYGIEGQPKM